MGLLDSVVGSVLNNAGGQQGGGGGLGALLPVITGMLSNDGQGGGMSGLVEKFQQAGMGDVVKSWIGTGENMPISADQITQALGSDTVTNIAAKLGVDPSQAAGSLSEMLPGIIDKLTPNGEAPAGGVNAGDLMGMLGGLLKR
jgi:uncharacterized protein YidB (DUF937 family)